MISKRALWFAPALAAAVAACTAEEKVATLPPPEVAVSQAAVQNVTEYFETTGRMAAVEAVDVRARVSGYITQVAFQDGANVKEGDVLFQIDARPYEAAVHEAEAQLARHQASLRKADAEVARNRSLLPKGAASERQLETAIAMKETDEAEIKATEAKLEQAKLELEWSRIVAPISGRVSRTSLTVGNLVQVSGSSSEPLTTIVKTDPIHLYFDVDERTLLRAQAGSRARGASARPEHVADLKIPIEVGVATDTGFPHKGYLDFVDNRVDPATGTIQARAVFDNGAAVLTPGLFCRVRMPLAESSGAVLVSERAIGTDQDGKYVLVVNDKNVVEYRPVKLGIQTEGKRVVEKGVAAGEWIITSGIQRVRPGITVKPQQAAAAAPAPAPAASQPEKSPASPPA